MPYQNGGLMGSKEAFDEVKIIAALKAGDEHAFDKLVAYYQPRVIKIISRYMSDREEIQDLTQETFIKAYNALDKFRGDSKFYTWLYRIAINTAKNYIIHQQHTVPTVDIELDKEDYSIFKNVLKELTNPENELLSEELQKQIYVILESMSDELKIALMLREVEGLSYEDIADVMDCPVGTIRSRIFRARDMIEEHLKELDA